MCVILFNLYSLGLYMLRIQMNGPEWVFCGNANVKTSVCVCVPSDVPQLLLRIMSQKFVLIRMEDIFQYRCDLSYW